MRRVPYHGAVAIRVAADKSEALKGALAAIAGIGSVETVSSANGQLLLRAVPKNGAGIVTDVASVIRQKAPGGGRGLRRARQARRRLPPDHHFRPGQELM